MLLAVLLQELEVQLHQDSDQFQEQISTLEEQITLEKQHKQDAEHEIMQQKQVRQRVAVYTYRKPAGLNL